MPHYHRQPYLEIVGYAAAGVMLVGLVALALTATVLDIFF
jgi:hypothetical protein